MRDYDRMVATRHKDDIAVFDSHRLVNVARVAVDALENKALRRVDAMVVGFLEQTLCRNVVHVVFVRGDSLSDRAIFFLLAQCFHIASALPGRAGSPTDPYEPN